MQTTNNKHPWHSITAGKELPSYVNGVIEIPMGCKGKYELDKESGLLRLDRVLYSSVHYPANYGFIPQTLADDNDPLDILIICSIEVDPLCIIESKVIGVMHMLDNGEKDEKIISVARNDMAVNYINSLEELPPHTMVELKRFFEDYKKLEHKEVEVSEFLGKEDAYETINKSVERYKQKYNSSL